MQRPSPPSDSGPPGGPSPELLAAYRAAIYRVTPAAGPPFDLRVGSSSAPLAALLETAGHLVWAWLTAVNPGSVRLATPANEARLAALDRELEALALPVVPGLALDPTGGWPPEASRLVLGLEEGAARRLARRFGQHAFLRGERGGPVRLVATSRE